MNSEYKEILPSGNGELIITCHRWSIQYYFPGPDNRYSGTFIHLAGIHIDDYINAYKNNWNKYLQIKSTAAELKGEIKVEGEMSMSINIGGFHDGVCINSRNMPLRTLEGINSVIYDYKWARERAEKVMQMLGSLK